MGTDVGVAVLGLGALGSRHAANLAAGIPGIRLVAVAEPVAERRREAKERYNVKTYADWRECLEDPDVEAVVIVTPSNTHAEVAIAAARAGKALFVEKPLAFTLEEADAVLTAVREAGVPAQFGFMRRVDPSYAAAKRAIEEGVIGRVVAYTGISRDPGPAPEEVIRTSGGIYLDSASHEFDIACYLLGDEVSQVFAWSRDLATGVYGRLGDADHACITLDFKGGALGQIEVSRHAVYGYDIRAEVAGTKGMIRIGYERETHVTVYTATGACHDFVSHWLDRFADAYRLEMEAFARVLQGRGAPPCTLEDGRRALVIGLAAQDAARLGRPVPVDSVEQHVK